MKNKKLLFCLISLSTLVLGACSGNEASTESTSSDTSTSEEHVHEYEFKKFEWIENPGAYLAKAVYECKAKDSTVKYEATMTSVSQPATCTEGGSLTWKASYDGHEDTKTEVLDPLGHDWGEPTWVWNGLHTSATATFTCSRDESHTHVETATGDAIVHSAHVDPTCDDDGRDDYTATVTFLNKEYKNVRTEVIPALEHPEIDSYGFCEICGEYTGVELPDPDQDYEFNNKIASTYYFRFNIDQHYLYKKVFSETLSEAWFNFYGKYGDNWEVINISSATFNEITQPKDDYVYLVLITTANVEYGSFRIENECAHNENIDVHGFCSYCGQYAFDTISKLDWESEYEMPAVDSDDTYYLRVEASKDNHISLAADSAWTQAFDEAYYLRVNEQMVEVNDFLGIYNGSQSHQRTSSSYFFTLDDGAHKSDDGYLYIELTNIEQDPTIAGDILTVTASHEPNYTSDQGYCISGCGEYAGKTVLWNQFNTDQSIKVSKNWPMYLRYEEEYYAHGKSSDYLYVQYKIAALPSYVDATFYYKKNGTYLEVEITTTFAQLPAFPDEADPYIYVKLSTTYDGSVSGTFRMDYTI